MLSFPNPNTFAPNPDGLLFLRLRGLIAEVDVQEYFIEDVDNILGILHHMTL